MPGSILAFRARAFVPFAFLPLRAGGFDRDITDTDVLQKPVNAVMIGDQPIKDRYRTFELAPTGTKEATRVSRSGVRQLGGGKPSFTTKSGSLRGSHK